MTFSWLTAAVATEQGRPGARTRIRVRAGKAIACASLLAALGGCSEPVDEARELAAQGVYTGALSADASYTLVGSLNHGASLWRNADHERLYNWSHDSGDATDLVAAAFSADGRRAVTTDPRTLVVWDTTSGSALAYWTTPAAVLAVALPADGTRVLMGLADHSAVLFDADAGNHLHTMLHDGTVGTVSVSRDGSRGLTGSDDETAVVWDLSSGEPVASFRHENPVRVVALSADGTHAFSAAANRQVVLWDATTGTVLHRLAEKNRGITTARFGDDGRRLLIGYVNRRVELWDTASGALLKHWETPARNPWHPTGAAILAVGFGPGSQVLALAGDGRLLTLRGS